MKTNPFLLKDDQVKMDKKYKICNVKSDRRKYIKINT